MSVFVQKTSPTPSCGISNPNICHNNQTHITTQNSHSLGTVHVTHTHLKFAGRVFSTHTHTHTCTAYLNQAYNYSVGRYNKRPGKYTRLGCIRHTWAREMSTSQRRRSVLPAADRRGKHLQNNHDNTLKTFITNPESKNIKHTQVKSISNHSIMHCLRS